jgi:hypothetical protein
LPVPRSKKSAATGTDDRNMPEHQEDRQYPGQEGGIIGDLLDFVYEFHSSTRLVKKKTKNPKKRGLFNSLIGVAGKCTKKQTSQTPTTARIYKSKKIKPITKKTITINFFKSTTMMV